MNIIIEGTKLFHYICFF